ncbi:contractile injection system tape measure protein [Balneolaceae bacterium ANBcel3]|nr:contractile injection system tape measure protein [Balneolaceae bacterium ANBcel3]
MIHRLFLELNIQADTPGRSAKWNDLQNTLSHQIESILDRVLSSLDRGGFTVLDSLDIDLGEIPFGNKNQWLSEIEKRLGKALQEKITHEKAGLPIETEGTIVLSQEKSGLTALTHYLNTGLLPWFMQGDHRPEQRAKATKKDHGWLEQLLVLSIHKHENELYAFLKENREVHHVLQRVITLDQEGTQILRFLAPEVYSPVLNLFQMIKQVTDISFRKIAMAELVGALLQAGRSNRSFRYVLMLFRERISRKIHGNAHKRLFSSIKKSVFGTEAAKSRYKEKQKRLFGDYLYSFFREEISEKVSEEELFWDITSPKSLIKELKENRSRILREIGQKREWIKKNAVLLEKESGKIIEALFPGIGSSLEWLYRKSLKRAEPGTRHTLSVCLVETAVMFCDEPPDIDEMLDGLIQVLYMEKPESAQVFFDTFQTIIHSDKGSKVKPIIRKLEKKIKELKKESVQKQSKENKSEHLKEGCYINHAGAVLIAPFLPTLFSRLSLLENKVFKSEDAREKAVQLIAYMVFGHMEAPEYDLALIKVLCGMDIEQDVLFNLKPGKKEMTEAEDVLVSVLQHWKALKSTSVEGLRTSFLQRNGMLRFSGDHWVLLVEQQAFDVLLSKLPWSISVISLPWMKERIIVEWG